ncbi:MAG: hypothetical protein GY798_19665, partial [Hyphomicrobiales bacterium]|nr:hypothetical protein [Hyphomicrobiales bacterium]
AASVMADNGNGIDDDPDGDTLTVTMVNGIGFIPGVAFALPSGALLTMNSDGTFTYDPNGVFDALPVGIVDQDTFTYTIDDGDSGTDNATATIEITGLDSDDTFVGTPGVDVFSGGVGNDTMTGLAGKDKLNGDGGKDTIDGGNDDDKLDGGGGKDVLNGGKGNDKLTGGGKSDTFVFNTKLNKKKNVDKVKDFKVNKDTIGLDEDIFKKVGSKLSKKEFEIGSKADDKSDRIIYDKKTGDLSYDKNGSKSGGKTLFAELDKGLKLDHKDFAVGDFVL